MSTALTLKLLAMNLVGLVALVYLYRRTETLTFLKPVRSAAIVVATFYLGSVWIALFAGEQQRLWLILSALALVQALAFVRISYSRSNQQFAFRKTWRQHRVLIVVATLGSVTPLACAVGVFSGRVASADLLARLQLVRPDVLDMPVEDRASLVRLGIRCRLNNELLESDAVLSCLRRAVETDSEAKQLESLVKKI